MYTHRQKASETAGPCSKDQCLEYANRDLVRYQIHERALSSCLKQVRYRRSLQSNQQSTD